MTSTEERLTCACGAVEYEITGRPILSAVCHCNSCRTAGAKIEARENAPRVLQEGGGTPIVVFDKKVVRCVKGEDRIESFKLDEKSVTNRLVATCCNALLMLTFDRGPYWRTVAAARLANPPAPTMRVQTRDVPEPGSIPDDVPRYAGWPLGFSVRLLLGWPRHMLRRS